MKQYWFYNLVWLIGVATGIWAVGLQHWYWKLVLGMVSWLVVMIVIRLETGQWIHRQIVNERPLASAVFGWICLVCGAAGKQGEGVCLVCGARKENSDEG